MRHSAFLELIASEPEGSACRAETHAGLLVLMFVELFQAQRHGVPVSGARAREAARTAVSALAQDCPLAEAMIAVCNRLSDAEMQPQALSVLTALGREYELKARWLLALDINDTIVETVLPSDNYRVLHDALLRRGAALRELSRLEESRVAYRAAFDEADVRSDESGRLRANIGFAKNAFARGNLQESETILREVVDRSTGCAELLRPRSIALHELATIAIHRGDFAEATRFLLDAYETASEPRAREEILVDVACVMTLAGEFQAAREIYTVAAETSRSRNSKWTACINLLGIAALEGNDDEFEARRAGLSAEDFPPLFRAEFQLHVGKGYLALGNGALARSWLESALVSASVHGAYRLVFAAEAALRDLTLKVERQFDGILPSAIAWREMVKDARRLAVTTNA